MEYKPYIGFLTFTKREILRFVRVANQTLIPPVLNAFLYLLIFGVFIGERIGLVNDHSYLKILVPGLIVMDIINSAYQNTSSSVFIAKWSKHIQEILISPLTHLEITIGYIIGGIVRSFFVSLCIYLIAGFFGGYSISHPFLFIFFFLMIAIGFSAIGIIIALWSDDWEQLSILTSYLLTPLTFLGGVFYSLSMLPPFLKIITLFNPLFYLIDGFRYSMIGTLEGNLTISMTLAVAFAIVTTIYTTYMLKTGYKLRP